MLHASAKDPTLQDNVRPEEEEFDCTEYCWEYWVKSVKSVPGTIPACNVQFETVFVAVVEASPLQPAMIWTVASEECS